MDTILVIDDDPGIRMALDITLEVAGYTVVMADSGVAAVTLLGKGEVRPDAILLDYMMPGDDGISTFGILRDLWPEIPVIMLTAHASVSLVTEFMGMGGADFIEKSDSRKEGLLDLRIKLVLRGAAARRQREAAEKAAIAMEARARVQDGLIRNMGHSLRTVANHLQPALRRLGRMMEGQEAAAPWLNLAVSAAAEIVGMSDDLADLVALEADGVSVLRIADCDPAAIAAAAVEDCREAAPGSGPALVHRSAGDAPKGMVADGDRLRRAFRALLAFAVQAASDGEVVLDHAGSPQGFSATITFRGHIGDKGDPFEIAADRGGAGGHGLDLALAKAVILAHGGELRMSPEAPSGTTVLTVTLPAPPPLPPNRKGGTGPVAQNESRTAGKWNTREENKSKGL
jgi:DNA-binding response OmpR family regulator